MSFFDKMFKKNALDEAMEDAFENFKENNPVTKKAKKTIEDAGKGITKNLEKQLYGEVQNHPEGQPSVLEDFDELSAGWDKMIDQIIDKELGKFKVCPKCAKAVPSELDTCPHCNSPLPDITAAYQICPHCGTKNRFIDFNCVNCGEPLELDPDAYEQKTSNNGK